jgi:hypothetical protein
MWKRATLQLRRSNDAGLSAIETDASRALLEAAQAAHAVHVPAQRALQLVGADVRRSRGEVVVDSQLEQPTMPLLDNEGAGNLPASSRPSA